jgi:hypothetical protein
MPTSHMHHHALIETAQHQQPIRLIVALLGLSLEQGCLHMHVLLCMSYYAVVTQANAL